VSALSWHPSSEEILTGGSDGACVWSLETGESRTRVVLRVSAVEWLPDGERFACASSGNGELFIYVMYGVGVNAA
jgi:WD40 repeat protein